MLDFGAAIKDMPCIWYSMYLLPEKGGLAAWSPIVSARSSQTWRMCLGYVEMKPFFSPLQPAQARKRGASEQDGKRKPHLQALEPRA